MDKRTRIMRQSSDSDVTPIKFWGTIILSVLMIMANIVLLRNVLQLPETTISSAAIVVHALVIVAGLTAIVLTLRSQQKLGAQIVFYAAILALVSGPFLYTERAFTTSFSLLVISAITITQLLPKEYRLRWIVITGMALISMWFVEWINPTWRITSVVSAVGWVSSIVLALILAVILVRLAWSGNIRVKMAALFTVLSLILVAIIGTVFYITYRNQVREDFRQRLMNIISITALQQDANLHATIKTPEDMQAGAYDQMVARNNAILASDPDLEHIYSMRQNEEGQFFFVLDSGRGEDYKPVAVGTMYNDPSDLLADKFASLDHPIVETEFYTNSFGTFLSAYAPIYRVDGTREGVIGVDIVSDKVVAQERSVFILVLGTTLGAMVLVTILGLFVGNLLTKPIINLAAIAHKITEGDLSARAEIETADEVGNLAVALNTMTTQLQATMQGLEKRVADRTRNLELAVEVGRSVSQVRDLNTMLKDACELILKEFNLYYVQLYLTSANQKFLNLVAGTGEVGKQLMSREHSLPLDVYSINGRAAVEKHSILVSDTTLSATFRKNPLLPETRSEIAVPLIVAGRAVGVLDMQSKETGLLDEEVLPAFEALAGQLAVAIHNANLLEEANEARAEVEKQARRLARQAWDEHLDAVHSPEWMGFKIDQEEVLPLVSPNEFGASEDAISSSISVTGEVVGSVIVEMDGSSDKKQAAELINIVSQQMARQIENLRLLESTERYRQKAELAISRSTMEGWKQFMETRPKGKLAYRYDTGKVQPLNHDPEDACLTLPIKTRDQIIGKISILDLEERDSDSLEIVNTVLGRLGDHIDSLRQHDQTQAALAQSNKLFDASRNLTQAADLQELLFATMRTLDISTVNRALLTTFEYGSENEVVQLTLVANWWNGEGNEVTPVGTRYSQEMIQLLPMFVSPTPVFFDDTYTDERVDEKTREFARRLNLCAVAVLPLHLGARQIGALFLEAEVPHYFTPEETRLFISLAPQIAAVLENRRQYEMAQRQAEREAMLNAINQKIQSATSVEAVLQIAARELGRALDASKAVAQLGVFKKNGSNGMQSNNHGQ